MRIDQENYELILFELLEGLIPEENQAELLQQIDADPFLSKEWKLMQQTVLQPEPVVYEGKSGLYQKPTVWLTFNRGLAVAATVVFLMGIGWMMLKQEPVSTNGSASYSVRTKTPAPSLPLTDDTPFVLDAQPTPSSQYSSDNNSLAHAPAQPEVEMEKKEATQLLPKMSVKNSIQLADYSKYKVQGHEPISPMPKSLKPAPKRGTRDINLPRAVNSVLIAAIQTTRFVKDLNRGRIQIQRNKVEDQPAIEVALVTDQYVKSAIIQYKSK